MSGSDGVLAPDAVRLPAHSPNINAFAERFVLSIKSDCLERLVPLGESHLRLAIAEYMRMDFGVNELLFDVLVCEYASTRAAKSNKDLLFVSKGLWAIESELARDSRQALRDFQKLALADCENKLFVGPSDR